MLFSKKHNSAIRNIASYIKRWILLLLIGILLLIAIINGPFFSVNREGLIPSSTSLTVTIKNTKPGLTFPNPFGYYALTMNSATNVYDICLNQIKTIPYSSTGDALSLTIVPKNTSATIKRDPYYADVFPEMYTVDMTFQDTSNNMVWALNESSSSRIYIKNGVLDIAQLGVIYDSSNNEVGAVKNDMFDTNHWMIWMTKSADISSVVFHWTGSRTSGTVPQKIEK